MPMKTRPKVTTELKESTQLPLELEKESLEDKRLVRSDGMFVTAVKRELKLLRLVNKELKLLLKEVKLETAVKEFVSNVVTSSSSSANTAVLVAVAVAALVLDAETISGELARELLTALDADVAEVELGGIDALGTETLVGAEALCATEVLGPEGLGPEGLGPDGLGTDALIGAETLCGTDILGPEGLGPEGLGPEGLGTDGLTGIDGEDGAGEAEIQTKSVQVPEQAPQEPPQVSSPQVAPAGQVGLQTIVQAPTLRTVRSYRP